MQKKLPEWEVVRIMMFAMFTFQCDGKCLKAYVHIAKAFLGLKKYEEVSST